MIMCSNDCSVKLNSERSFLVKFVIYLHPRLFSYFTVLSRRRSTHVVGGGHVFLVDFAEGAPLGLAGRYDGRFLPVPAGVLVEIHARIGAEIHLLYHPSRSSHARRRLTWLKNTAEENTMTLCGLQIIMECILKWACSLKFIKCSSYG